MEGMFALVRHMNMALSTEVIDKAAWVPTAQEELAFRDSLSTATCPPWLLSSLLQIKFLPVVSSSFPLGRLYVTNGSEINGSSLPSSPGPLTKSAHSGKFSRQLVITCGSSPRAILFLHRHCSPKHLEIWLVV